VATLAEELHQVSGGAEIIGDSPLVQTLREEISVVAPTDTAVLVLGETGTGKELCRVDDNPRASGRGPSARASARP
jgi:transcriptional regulator with GAF, ATPase, and Fis domain